MANRRDLKKDINFVLGDIIEAVYIWETGTGNSNSKEGNAIIDKAITSFDDLMVMVHKKDVSDKKKHFKEVRKSLEEKATALVEALNTLS